MLPAVVAAVVVATMVPAVVVVPPPPSRMSVSAASLFGPAVEEKKLASFLYTGSISLVFFFFLPHFIVRAQ